jgi:hypothetical protein
LDASKGSGAGALGLASKQWNLPINDVLAKVERGLTMLATQSYDVTQRGYAVFYHAGQTNFCPGCGHSHWYLGRTSAECAICSLALPIVSWTNMTKFSFAKAA